jgi:primosomal protein N' (replication factor Y)
LDREFEYLIPEQVDGNVALGSRVLVPFGRTRTRGYVVGLASESDRQDLKSILSVDAPEPLLVDSVLRLVRWMSEYYCAPIEQVLKSVLPSPVRRGGMQHRRRLFVSVCDAESSDVPKLSAKQTATWSLLSGRGDMFLHEIIRELGITASPVRALEKKGLVKIGDAPDRRNPLSNRTILPTQPLALSDEQQGALDALTGMCDAVAADAGGNASRVMLLHGITGSGKTEVYLQAIEHVLEVGRTAIILVPEIALTPQTIERFVSRFGDAVAVLHSKLSDGERYDEWHRIRQGTARIVVGARSAVFAPTPNLGLVVVDEEHEPSYKQEEAPRYNARDVAVMRTFARTGVGGAGAYRQCAADDPLSQPPRLFQFIALCEMRLPCGL